MTNSAVKTRRRLINDAIGRGVLRLPDSECHVWLGLCDHVTGMPFVMLGGKRIWVKAWLRRREDGTTNGVFRVYRTSCRVGKRCVNPAHNSIHKEYPWETFMGWVAEYRERQAA